MNGEDGGQGQSNSEARPSKFTPPQINLPKGGGAIRGIDEKFAANPLTGAGSLAVPLPLSPGRSGFAPKLSVDYDSGAGNGVFGIGWKLSLPSIVRRTDKGLPQYRDSVESDIFVLSGAEDLVPVLLLGDDARLRPEEFERDGYRVKRYRPRIDTLFARIERWTCIESGESHWRSLSSDNVLTVYGLDAGSRVADPENPEHVFSWLICRSYDDTGNAVVYDYVGEDGRGVDLARPCEHRRDREANRYPKRIRYGNQTPLLLDPERPGFRRSHLEPHDLDAAGWMFEVVFDYGEGHYCEAPPDSERRVSADATPLPSAPWPARRDPFSTFRSRFEVRTYRLCRRVMMFHRFPEELGAEPRLVRSTAFGYRQKAIGSFLERVVQSGHRRREDGRYLTRSLPPLELFYTPSPLEDPDFEGFRLSDVDPADLANLPAGIDDSSYRLLDLDGEGIAGVLTEQAEAWFYKPNLGDGRFGAVRAVGRRPATSALADPQQQFMDLTGDGVLDLVDFAPSNPGFYERNANEAWSGFRAFHALPVQDWTNANLRFVDLTGDGVADVLITEDDAFTWHASLLDEGFDRGRRVPVPLDEEHGPRVVFADNTETLHLADMTGDGLSDLVRIRNGEVCYWPNRGYGRFGAKIVMDRAPWFDEPDQFESRRIRLADTDGSGPTDIIYLGRDGAIVTLNESGNGWSAPRHVQRFPVADHSASITVADVLGRGTACLVWSSPLPGDAGRQLRVLDLMCGRKPHLLERSVNNLGAETRIDYASSTKFYLADKAAGTPWATRLPFPVHVVERVETYDRVSRNRFVTRFSYHHGYYDGVEREFRGFGRVDQLDTESFAALSESGRFPRGDNIDAASSVSPALTKTWRHTGVFLDGGRISRHLAHEYYQEGELERGKAGLSDRQIRAMLLDDTILPAGLAPEEAREACRSLKGSMLRQEVYGLDETEAADRPYSVTESNFTIRALQRCGPNRHAVFLTHAREQLAFHYERKLYETAGGRRADPRVSHSVTLSVDDYGNVLKSAAIGYGRRFPDSSPLLTDADRERQARLLLTLTESDFTNVVAEADAWRTPLAAEQRVFELWKVKPDARAPGITNLFRFGILAEKIAAAGDGAHDLPFRDWQGLGAVAEAPYRRLVRRSRSIYRADDLRRLLPPGRLEALALPGQNYALVFPGDLLTEVYRRCEPPEDLLPDRAPIMREAGYVDLEGDGNWWAPSGRVFYATDEAGDSDAELAEARRHFFMVRRYRDPFGKVTHVAYDRHDLAPVETRDAVGNVTRAEIDYRTLAPRLATDPNGNRSEVAFDALGFVAGSAVMGKAGENLGDSLEGFEPDLVPAQLAAFFDDPHGCASRLLGDATIRNVYDVDRYAVAQKPVFAATIARETHLSDLRPGERSKTQISLHYSDGFGREVQTKRQASPGPIEDGGPDVAPRWIGGGWTIFDNKGSPVRQYEPFFASSHDFEFAAIRGVSPILFYDPVGRLVATLNPDKTWGKVVFDPWRQARWDANDTIAADPRSDRDVGAFLRRLPESDCLPTWFERRIDGGMGSAEQAAAEQAVRHADTPRIVLFDTLGRAFLGIDDNGAERKYLTRTVLDIEGNRRAVVDALERVVIRCDFAVGGVQLHEASMEAGKHWLLKDIGGRPVRSWTSRRYDVRTEYDALRRQVRSFVRGGDPYERGARPLAKEILFDRTVYGDGDDARLSEHRRRAENLRGKPYERFDTTGIVTTDRYDFKGNLLRSERRFARDYRGAPDWSDGPAIEAERFAGKTSYDALNRPVTITAPDGSVGRLGYNEAGLIDTVAVALRGAERDGEPLRTPFVRHIEYNARGQRTRVEHANGAVMTSAYDPETFRLIRLTTERPRRDDGASTQIFADEARVQHLHYTYDPVGNITEIADHALRTVFHRNRKIESVCRYAYDALYRLTRATGRENVAQAELDLAPTDGDYRDYPFVGATRLGDPQALQEFAESYEYDPVGNFIGFVHHAERGGWSRRYAYREESLLEPGKHSNRLSQTQVQDDGRRGPERYLYDANGDIVQMPHLPSMQWDFMDRLAASARQVVNEGASETTFYQYDAGGQRVRKVTERRNGMRKNERLYVGGFEVFREYDSDGDTIALERETLHVMDDKTRVALVETLTRERGHFVHAPEPVQRYQLANHLGSATLELDEAARLISYEEYAPYGATTYQAGRHAGEVRRKRYRYIGLERDDETGLSVHGPRYYAAWLGRWSSCDPIGVGGGQNLYAYAAANPITSVDSTGHQPENALEDLFTFIANTAKFMEAMPLGRTWQKFGQDVHTRATAVLDELKRAPASERLVDVERVYSEVRVDKGAVTQIGGKPGGSRGALNPDLIGTRKGQSINLSDTTADVAARSEVVGDIKAGGGKIAKKYSALGGRQITVNGVTSSADTDPALLRMAEPQVVAPAEAELAGKPRVGLGTVATVAVTAGVLLGPGTAKEKAETLAVGYGLAKGTELVTTSVVGSELAGVLALPIAFAFGLCGDQASACEDQARAKAQQEVMDELNERAGAIYQAELASGGQPEWNFAFAMAVHERYVQLGLDKADAALDKARKEMLGDPNPNVCSKYGPVHPLVLSQPVLNNTGPQMYAR